MCLMGRGPGKSHVGLKETAASRIGTMDEKHREDVVGWNVTTPPPRHNPPAQARRARRALLTIAGAGIVAYLDLCVRRKIRTEEPRAALAEEPTGPPTETRAEGHWENAVDMNAAGPPRRWNPSSWSHRVRVTLVGAQRLIEYGYLAGGYPPTPGYRNLLVIGALLSILGLIPTDCLQPTRSWRQHDQDRTGGRRMHGG